MPFTLVWLEESTNNFRDLEAAAQKSLDNRQKFKKEKASMQEGLFNIAVARDGEDKGQGKSGSKPEGVGIP